MYTQVCSEPERFSKVVTTFTKAQYSDGYQFSVLLDGSPASCVINWNINYSWQNSCYSNFMVSFQFCTENIPFCPKFCLFAIITWKKKKPQTQQINTNDYLVYNKRRRKRHLTLFFISFIVSLLTPSGSVAAVQSLNQVYLF